MEAWLYRDSVSTLVPKDCKNATPILTTKTYWLSDTNATNYVDVFKSNVNNYYYMNYDDGDANINIFYWKM